MTDESRIADELTGRLARLPWITFHTRIVLAVGVLWVLAGLAANAVAAVGLAPVRDPAWMGGAAAAYLFGEVVGVLGGGALARGCGRRRVLWAAALVFVAANAAPALAPGVLAYTAMRFAAGAACGAEFAAVLDAVGELLPRPRRTPVLLTVNALYWLGGLLGAAAQLALAQPGAVHGIAAWRAGLLLAPALALLLAGACGLIPESPSWLVRRGRADRAAIIVDTAERDARAAGHAVGRAPTVPPAPRMPDGAFAALAAMVRADRAVTVRAVMLCAAQGLAYGAVLFTLVALATGAYGADDAAGPAYAAAFALAGLVGAVVFGRLLEPGGHGLPFAVTHLSVGGPLALAGVLMNRGVGSSWMITLLVCLSFLAAAPSTVLFVADAVARYPEGLRRPAARVLAAATRLGAVPGPLLFGALLGAGGRPAVSAGYIGAALVLIATGVAAAVLRTPEVTAAADEPFAPPPRRPAARAAAGAPAAWTFPPPPGAAGRDDAAR